MTIPPTWKSDGRRELGLIDGCEEEAWVRLLSASPDDPRPVLEVVVAEINEHDDGEAWVGYIDPRRMADVLIDAGYAAPLSEGGTDA